MPNQRGFRPLDGAIFPCNPPGFLRKNCLPAAQNPSPLDTLLFFKQALAGKTAIITGSSYGMGQTMAELFAQEGEAVVLTARHQEKLDQVVENIRAKGGRAVGVVADVCSTEDTKRVFEMALKEFGDVDILINNAGIGEQKLIDETDDDWMMYVMNTNLGGPEPDQQLGTGGGGLRRGAGQRGLRGRGRRAGSQRPGRLYAQRGDGLL